MHLLAKQTAGRRQKPTMQGDRNALWHRAGKRRVRSRLRTRTAWARSANEAHSAQTGYGRGFPHLPGAACAVPGASIRGMPRGSSLRHREGHSANRHAPRRDKGKIRRKHASGKIGGQALNGTQSEMEIVKQGSRARPMRNARPQGAPCRKCSTLSAGTSKKNHPRPHCV